MATGWVYEDSTTGGAGWRPMTNADLPSSGVTAATYGDSTHVGQFTVNAQGIITSASSVAVSGVAPSGAAGGDLGGTYPNPTVVAAEETSGPTRLAFGAITSGEYLLRSGGTITSGTPSGTSPLTTKGDVYGYSTTGARIPVGTDGQVLTADSSQTLGVRWQNGTSVAGGGLGVYGDGSDGTQTFDGTSVVLGITPDGSKNYTLTRDIFLAASTINANAGIITNGFRVFCQGTLTNNGTIQWNGGAGAESTGGGNTANTNSTINSGSSGTAPGTAGGSGAVGAGGTGVNSTLTNYGGRGGTGGTGTGGAGGAGGTLTAQAAKMTPPRFLPLAVVGQIYTGDATRVRCSGGTGGGAGGGDGANNGAGGGAGGGVVIVAARAFAGTGAIQARGGNGGTRTAGNTGGGGGGGGGLVLVISGSISGGAISGQTVDANGGTKGSPHGTGTNNANDGNGGTVILLPN